MLHYITTRIFRAYDWCYLRYYRLNREDTRAGNLILFHRVRHNDDAITLSDGTCVQRGDLIVVIHVKLRPGKRRALTGMNLVADFRNSLRVLASEIQNNPPIYRDVRAIRGNTVFGPVARHFGFDARPVVDMGTIVHRLGLANARTLVASSREVNTGKISLVTFKNPTLWTIWMSQKTLMSRYHPTT